MMFVNEKKFKIMIYWYESRLSESKEVLENLKLNKNFELKIVVSGTHVLKEYGNTYKEIIKDGFKIYKKSLFTLGLILYMVLLKLFQIAQKDLF